MPSHIDTTRHRAAARDALAARIRRITGAVLALSALASGGFAALAAASAPGRHLQTAHTKTRAPAPKPKPATAHTATIPPLPPAPGPGNDAAPPPPTPTPAPAPAPTPAPPVVSSGGS